MNKIDITEETAKSIMDENNEEANAVLLRTVVNKINEIIDWINSQE